MITVLRLRFIFLALVIICAIAVRFVDLGTHFSHIDDLGVAQTIFKAKAAPQPGELTNFAKLDYEWQKWTAVSRHWTYAPGQFFLTTLLLHPGQNYRQALFWGRFPSFLFSILSLLLWIYFYKRYDNLQTPAVSISLFLLAFSWTHIIYAKQMESYAIGVFSAVVLFILLWEQIQPGRHSLKSRIIGAMITVILCHTQYQILFLAPAYFLTIFWHDWTSGADEKTAKKCAVLNLLIPVFIFAASIYPMYLAFLKRQSTTAGVTWNSGLQNEFAFHFATDSSLISKAGTFLIFFLKNTYIVFGSMTAFIPETHPAFTWLHFLFFALFVMGIVELALTSDPRKKMLKLFLAAIAITWVILICKGHLAYSPTRHSLILLPFMAYLTAEGWLIFLKRVRFRYATLLLLGVSAGLFLSSVPGQTAKRHDPFDEQKISSVLKKYQVDALMTTNHSHHPALMPSVLSETNYFENETMEVKYIPRTSPPFKTLAFLSYRDKLSIELFYQMKFKVGLKLRLDGQKEYESFGEAQDYKLVYMEQINSLTQIEPNSRTYNGTNSYYFYVLERA